MPRAKRRKSPGSPTSADAPIDPDVARFAARTFQQQAAERDAKRAEREARQREEEHQQLLATKDAAVAEVKRLRTRDHVKRDDAAAAEAAYRLALANLIEFETGSAPGWAGPTTSAVESPSEAELDDVAESPDGGEMP
jgi:DNA-binding transcriptional regulator YiaG